MSWDTDLSGAAKRIAASEQSPIRVIAGPGTGKSFVLKRRVARGLEIYQPPENWFVIEANDLDLRPCLETMVDVFRV